MPAYERVANDCTDPVVVDEGLISSLLEERHHFRTQRKWEEADSIFRDLVAAGVLIDDKKKTWNLGPRRLPEDPKEVSGHVMCEMCRKRFRSRNQLFKHLRQPGPCALDCFDPLNADEDKMAKKVKVNATKVAKPPGLGKRYPLKRLGPARHADAEACLWLGDLPTAWAQRRRIGQMLYRFSPAGVQQAWVKRVVKRQYKNAQGKSLGYAIVCYRDAEEADLARKVLDGLHISAEDALGAQCASVESFILRARQAEHGDSAAAVPKDPSPIEQLRPLPLSELQRRVGAIVEDQTVLEAAAGLLASHPRKARCTKGIKLPNDLSVRLLKELQSLRWPAKNQRPCLTSERYLVLHSNVKESYVLRKTRCRLRSLTLVTGLHALMGDMCIG
ncbi:unnamed protein product [Durusdinium trenchii]|uniref:C2H2-type domain-containing protein n=1 Tax=Durusdinium trenchii TaxID=1381693 RepID=A0ABP0PBD6_9DINO